MKRTGEIVLIAIGLVLAVVTTFVGSILKSAETNQEIHDIMMQSLADIDASQAEINDVFQMINDVGPKIFIGSIILMVIGAISIVLLIGNKNPKVAGILLIAGTVILGIYTQLGIFLTGIFFLIAGIMALVRKKSEKIEEEYYLDL